MRHTRATMIQTERKRQPPKLRGNVSSLSPLFAFCTSHYIQRLVRQGRFFSFNAVGLRPRRLRKKNVGKPSKPLDFVIENLINRDKCQKANNFFGGVSCVVGSLLSRSPSVGVGSVRPLPSSVVVPSWLRLCLSCLPFCWFAVRLALRSCRFSPCRSSGVVRLGCPSCRRPSSFGCSPVGVGVGLSPLLPQTIVSVVSESRNKQKQKSR